MVLCIGRKLVIQQFGPDFFFYVEPKIENQARPIVRYLPKYNLMPNRIQPTKPKQ